MIIAAAGCGIGIVVAAAVSIVTRSQFYGPSTLDPLAFGGSVGLMLMTMLLASVIPARRAARIDRPSRCVRIDEAQAPVRLLDSPVPLADGPCPGTVGIWPIITRHVT